MSPLPTLRSTRRRRLAEILDVTGWGRKLDKVGITFVSNEISSDHRQYLGLGGLGGFLLGDGRLSYGWEHRRHVLHCLCLAWSLHSILPSVHRSSRLQSRSRACG